MWQIVLLSLSAILFFGFVALSVRKFGLLSCFSAYAPLWKPEVASKLNAWQIVTLWSAFLIVPVILEQGEGSAYQFLGFLAPVSLTLVAASPDYQTSTFQNVIHQIGAWSAVVFIIAYSILIPKMFYVVAILAVIALVLGLVKKGTLMFWGEMAMYLATYIILFVVALR